MSSINSQSTNNSYVSLQKYHAFSENTLYSTFISENINKFDARLNMSKFLTGKELEKVVYDIIWEAQDNLIIISPFIKLDDYFKKLFENHLNNPHLNIKIVFGKNEENKQKSLRKEDFDFFKKFLNISIIYVNNLHAKYYGNEKKGLITSINLYDYSFKNNIEFGVYSEVNLISKFTNSPDQEAWEAAHEIAETNEAIFIKRPVYEKRLLSSLLGKSYIKSDILLDDTERFYRGQYKRERNKIQIITDFPTELEIGYQQLKRPEREIQHNNIQGFCIRTGINIPFNPNRPYSNEAYKSWSNWNNWDFPEKFCHKTGKSSLGKTSMRNPVLYNE
jgi:hypothetical protein